MENKQKNDSFECQQCGACCRWPGHVLLTNEDVRRLARALEVSEDDFIRDYTALARNRRQLALTERSDGSCVFLDENACRLYAARPEQCRIYPAGWQDTSGCPAMEQTGDV
jgi:Fe-S-cluster containining protein